MAGGAGAGATGGGRVTRSQPLASENRERAIRERVTPGATKSPVAGRWVWLFPATMVIHVAEEALTGETFPTWISRVAGVDLSMREFLVLNGLALLVVVIGTALALRWRESGWPVAALGTAVATNVVFHLSGAGLTGSWSPGLASATILWLPLGAFALVRTWRRAPRVDLAIGIAIGFVAHGLVSLALVLA